MMSHTNDTHSVLIGYILWIFGFTGSHRFYYGKPITGTIWFFTAGLLLIGWIIDLFLIPGMARRADLRYQAGHLDYTVAWILLTFLGIFGIHRFYMGKWITGIVYLLTGGLLGLGLLYDLWTLNGQVSEIIGESRLLGDDDGSHHKVQRMLNLAPLVHAILEEYALSWHGTHGIGHWARVLENGLRLAEATGADVEVVRLFAVFHDSRRVNEGVDDGHGKRGAELAASFHGRLFTLSDDRFDLLYAACVGHTDGGTDGDVTIRTCWDSDRLDLGRVGIRPEPKRLCTPAAKRPDILEWADGRGHFQVIPQIVTADWAIGVKP